MQNKQIRRRIQQLKVHSARLKEISRDPGNEQQITQILSQTKRFVPDYNIPFKQQQPKIAINKQPRIIGSISRQILSAETMLFKQSNFNTKQKQKKQNGYNNVDEEILILREQNLKLQKLAKKYKEELDNSKLNANKNNQISQNLGGTYYKLYQPLLVFSTRIKIKEQDYEKIDFTRMYVELNRNIIRISKVENKVWKQFYIETITDVRYEQRLIVFEFTRQDQVEYLFLLFQSVQDQHKWDLGIYINRVLRNSFKKQRLFEDQFKFALRTQTIERTSQKQQIDKVKQKERQKQKQKEKQKSEQKQPLSNQQVEKPKIQKVPSGILLQKQIEVIYQDQNEQRVSDLKGQVMKGKINQMNIENKKLNQAILRDINLKKSKLMSSQSNIETSKPGNISAFNSEKQMKKKPDQIIQINNSIISDIPEHHSISFTTIEQDNAQKQMQKQKKQHIEQKQKIVKLLKDGYFLTKYSTGGWKPHDKRVFLDMTGLQLCWQDVENKKINKIKLQDITNIQTDKFGPGIQKQKSKNLQQNQCCIIQTDKRTLQFSAIKKQTITQFASSLCFMIQDLFKRKKSLISL